MELWVLVALNCIALNSVSTVSSLFLSTEMHDCFFRNTWHRAKGDCALPSVHSPVWTGLFTHNFLSLSHLVKKTWGQPHPQLSGFCVTTGPLSGHHHFGPWQSSQIPIKRKVGIHKYLLTCSFVTEVSFFYCYGCMFPYVETGSGRTQNGVGKWTSKPCVEGRILENHQEQYTPGGGGARL